MKILNTALLTSFVFILACNKKETQTVPAIEKKIETPNKAVVESISKPFGFVDQSAKDLSFSDFKKALNTSLKNQDLSVLAENLSDEIQVHKTGETGKAAMKIALGLETLNEKSAVVQSFVLGKMDEGGCIIDDSTFSMPYIFCAQLPESCDIEEVGSCGMTTENKVEVFEKPDSTSKILLSLHEEYVTVMENMQCGDCYSNCKWKKIRLPNKSEGFVKFHDVVTRGDGHIAYAKRNNKWVITELMGPGVNCAGSSEE